MSLLINIFWKKLYFFEANRSQNFFHFWAQFQTRLLRFEQRNVDYFLVLFGPNKTQFDNFSLELKVFTH